VINPVKEHVAVVEAFANSNPQQQMYSQAATATATTALPSQQMMYTPMWNNQIVDPRMYQPYYYTTAVNPAYAHMQQRYAVPAVGSFQPENLSSEPATGVSPYFGISSSSPTVHDTAAATSAAAGNSTESELDEQEIQMLDSEI